MCIIYWPIGFELWKALRDSSQASKHTHACAQWSHASVGSPRLAPIIFAVVDWVWLKKYVRVGTEVDATQEGKVVSLSIHWKTYRKLTLTALKNSLQYLNYPGILMYKSVSQVVPWHHTLSYYITRKMLNHPGASLSEKQLAFGMPTDMQLSVQPDYYGYRGMG